MDINMDIKKDMTTADTAGVDSFDNSVFDRVFNGAVDGIFDGAAFVAVLFNNDSQLPDLFEILPPPPQGADYHFHRVIFHRVGPQQAADFIRK